MTGANIRTLHWSMSWLMLFCRIVSRVASNTNFMFSVSTAVVKWWKRAWERSFLRELKSSTSNFWTSSSLFGSARGGNWSGKWSLMLETLIFSFSKSVLLRKRMMDTFANVLLLTMASKMSQDSTRRFVLLSSRRDWSYSLEETRNNIQVTHSKHWYHFCLCDLCPPTSTNKNGTPLMMNSCSDMLFVGRLACKMSKWVGS